MSGCMCQCPCYILVGLFHIFLIKRGGFINFLFVASFINRIHLSGVPYAQQHCYLFVSPFDLDGRGFDISVFRNMLCCLILLVCTCYVS